MNSLWLAFITGLTTGGISCLAVQGGLLASSIANRKENLIQGKKNLFVSAFLISKLFAYTLLGLGLGLLGASLIISPKFLGLMQILAGLFMLVTAARLLDIHPVFRHFAIEPPKWALKLMRKESKSSSLFAPSLLGFLTIFIPCGVTQAMMVLAVSSGNPLFGAGIMFAFTLGTSPLFFAAGYAVSEIIKRKVLVYAAASMIIILGFISINTGQILRGSVHNFDNYLKVITGNVEPEGKMSALSKDGFQEVVINVDNTKYTASTNVLKANIPVRLILNTQNTLGCIRAFTIPSLNVSEILPETGSKVIEFTPTKKGYLSYSCSMGMYGGSFTIVD